MFYTDPAAAGSVNLFNAAELYMPLRYSFSWYLVHVIPQGKVLALIMVAVGQKLVIWFRPFLVNRKEGAVTKDHTTRSCILVCNSRSLCSEHKSLPASFVIMEYLRVFVSQLGRDVSACQGHPNDGISVVIPFFQRGQLSAFELLPCTDERHPNIPAFNVLDA